MTGANIKTSGFEDIARIRSVLRNKPRDLLLFDLAVQTGAAVKHILQLKVKDLLGLKPGDPFQIPAPGHHQPYFEVLSKNVYQDYRNYVHRVNPAGDDYLFLSRKGNKPLTIQSTSRLVKQWLNKAEIPNMGGVMFLKQLWERCYRSSTDTVQGNPVATRDLSKEYGLNEINVPSIQDAVYSELLRAIVSIRIRPGEKIIAEKIARQMKVSRIPVREALKRLEVKGLVVSRQNRGTFAAELSLTTLNELLEIRLVNEKTAARQAARKCSRDTIDQLQRLHEKYVATWDRDKMDGQLFEINRQFHFTIYREAGMPILHEIITLLWDRFSPYLYLMIDQTDVLSDRSDIGYHEGILRGLKDSDPEAVGKWLEADMWDTHRIIEQYFRLHQMADQEVIDRFNG